MSQIPDGPPESSPSVTDPYAEYELPVEGFTGTPEEVEQQWYEQCYLGRGDSIAQLTWRAILMGSVLGGVLSLTNLYIGLKAGWGFGVAITACILSYAIWTTLYKIGLARTKMTILENNCMQSTASSAGYSTGGTLVSAFAAYIMLNNETLPMPLMFAWVFFLAVLGGSGAQELSAGSGILLLVGRMLLYLALAIFFGLTVLPRFARWTKRLPITQVQLNAAALLPGVFLKLRQKPGGPKRDAGEAFVGEGLGQLVWIDEGRPHQFEGRRGPSTFREVGAFDETCPRVDASRGESGHVG